MVRYYLIPFDPVLPKGADAVPKYLGILGACSGLCPKETTGGGARQWLRSKYVLKVAFATATEFAPLEAQPDVILLYPNTDRAAIKAKLMALDVDVSTLAGTWTFAQAKSALHRWLVGSDDQDYIGGL